MQIIRINKKVIFIGITCLLVTISTCFFWRKALLDGLYKEKNVSIQSAGDQVSDVNPKEENVINSAVPVKIEENSNPDILVEEKENDLPIVNNDKKEVKITESKQESVATSYINWGYEVSPARKISAIIIHSSYDALGKEPYNLRGLLAEYKSYGVSAHYVIDREGVIHQLVADKNIAYHAGKSQLPNGETSVNAVSIGIELMNTEKDNYTGKQYQSLEDLVAKLKDNYPIKYVLGHKDIAPGRKTDPWNFNWNKL